MRPARRECSRLPEVDQEIVPVIMAGGTATRLWPLSTRESPKQFHHLTSARTMIQETVLRLRDAPGLHFTDPIIVCNRRHVSDVEKQLAEIGIQPSIIVSEPFGRNTAAVAAMAGILVKRQRRGALALLLPADHLISDAVSFVAAVALGAKAPDRIVTFGIEPREPLEGYGYIQCGRLLDAGVYTVERFIEKPTRTVAQAYILDGGYFWNSGVFLFSPDVIATEIQAHEPDIWGGVADTLAASETIDNVLKLSAEHFARTPSESFDVAVMERTRRGAVVPCNLDWTDIGSWSELWRLGPLDSRRNRIEGEAIVLDTSNSLIWSDGPPVGVVGLDDVVVVAAHGAVLVASKAKAQSVRLLAEAFANRSAEPSHDDRGPTEP